MMAVWNSNIFEQIQVEPNHFKYFELAFGIFLTHVPMRHPSLQYRGGRQIHWTKKWKEIALWTFRLDSEERFQVTNGTEEVWSSFTSGQTYQRCSWCIWPCLWKQGWMTGQSVVTAIPTFQWFHISNSAAKFLFPQSCVSVNSFLLRFSVLLGLCHPCISENMPCPHFHASLLHILNLLILCPYTGNIHSSSP